MRLKSMMLLAVASGCGLVAMFLFQQVSSNNNLEAGEEKIEVLVSTVEITPGQPLDKTNSEFREYPISVVPQNAVTLPEEYEGLAIRSRAFPGDFVTLDKLTKDKAASSAIPKGMTVIAINVDSAMMSGGLLLPGDKVDVMVTYMMRTSMGAGTVIKTVLEFVEVFSTGKMREIDGSATDTKVKTISLLATPQQAALVKLAEKIGDLHLSMRSKDDSEPRATEEERFDPKSLTDFYDDSEEEGDEETGDEEADDNDDSDDDLDSFLDDAMQPDQPDTTTTVASPVVPTAPAASTTWTIEIYAGDQLRVQEVPLPQTESSTVTLEDGTVVEKTGNPIIDGIRSLFGGDSKTTTDSTSTEPALPEATEPAVSASN
ncbi:MAG: Flp pilus assembly protein CpaB [Planctomycetota bacterium]|jgi:pilus assembly protein CpaB